ncbi:MAG: DUF6443 domain-containing protein, partial [Rikenellaceae bacterium]|nr:DUF6443 domain-containing protein [Rikenellaceae bacterium]MCL2693422.1 DUF6443 domain-containing protein [Rikenellaceae bacterium]
MRKLYISLLLFLAVGFCQMGVKAQYLLPLSFIHEFVPDLEAHSGLPGAFTIRYADNGDMNVFAVPYKGITAGPGVTDSDVVAIINQMIDMAQGGGLADYVMCIGVTGVDTSNPMASEGFIYFISKLFYLSNPFHYEVILWSSMNFGSWAHIIHNYDPYLSNHYGYKLFSDEYIIYGLEYSESGSNVNFSITGPRAEISTFSLRKVVWGQSASTWQTVATFNHTIPWTPANIPSAVFSVAASQLQSGERYALVNNTYNQVASNVVEYGSAALSPTVFNVTGAWANPPQQMSYSVSLSGSQAGVSYSLVRVSETPTSPILNTTVAMITGTGSAITFAGIIQNGVYKVVAKQGNTTVDMNGEVTVVMPPLQIFAVTGSWNNQQQTSFSVTLSGSQAGVSYALILERRYPTLPLQNTQVTTMSGTGNSITFAGLTQTGIYKIVAKRGNETLEMNGRADMSSSAIMTVTNTNHIRTRRYTTAAGNLFSESATHYDGLGRPVQTVSVAAGGNGNDIIRLVAYDNMGRSDMTTYMPFTRSSLGFKMAAFATGEQQEYYNQKFATDPDRLYAFGQKKFEYSAAEDKVIQSAPGENTRMQGGRTLHTVARASRANENIKKMAIIAADNRSLHYQGHYPDKALTVTESWQEAGVGETKVVSAEYVDVRGHLVAKRVTAGNDIRTTYYVYDDMGNQRYIIPPIQESSIAVLNAQYSPEQLQRHCFYMVYDRYGNVVEQWVPGADPVYSVYDRRGRLVMSQSGNQRANNRNEWSYFKYDALDRQVYSGIHVGGTLQAHRDAVASPTNVLNERRGGAVHGYTSLSYPSNVTASSVLAVTYYDDYDWPGANLLAFSTADLLAGNASAPSFDITGLATGTKLKVLDATATTDQWLTTVTYYDKDYRSVQSVGELYPSGIEVVSNDHNFTGAVTQTKVKQTIDGQSYEYNKWFVYDSQGRLLHVDQAMTGDSGNGRVRLASYSYDDMNVTSTKSIHDGRETTGYTYRMTGQLWRETSPSFSYALGFDRAADAGLSFRRDGKLASVAWGAGSDLTKAYNFTYDVVGQLTAAHFSQKSGGTWTAQPQFAESGLTYDLNGNILTLTRTAEQPQGNQNIQYTYNHATRGNLLTSVSFGGTNFAFSYDANGNMVDDMMAGTKIVYNLLDLPEKIHAQNNANNNIRYIYSAS